MMRSNWKCPLETGDIPFFERDFIREFILLRGDMFEECAYS